jgi:hypothetical protein
MQAFSSLYDLMRVLFLGLGMRRHAAYVSRLLDHGMKFLRASLFKYECN